jgi:transcriptional regulator with XRE-family HTH domain
VAYVPTVKRRRLGTALRRLREAAGHSTDSAAATLGWSQSKVSRIETASTAVTPEDVQTLLELYGTTQEEITRLVKLATEDEQLPWWRQYSDVLPKNFSRFLSLESEASRITIYQGELVPGLLQIDAYARVILAENPLLVVPYEIEQTVRLRMARQFRLRGDDPVELGVVMSEAAVRCMVGGPEVMQAQLMHIVEAASRPNITVRLLPFAAGAHPASNGSFTLFEFADNDDPSIVCVDSLITTLYRESQREVGTYQLAYERLCALAMSPEDTVAFLRRTIEEGKS